MDLHLDFYIIQGKGKMQLLLFYSFESSSHQR